MRFPFSPPDDDDDDDDDEAVVVGSSSSNSNNDDDDRSGGLAIPTTSSPTPPVQHHQLHHHHHHQLHHHHQQQQEPSMHQRQKATNLFHSWYEGGSKEVGVGGKRVGAIRLKAGESSVPIATQSQLSSYNLYRNVQARRRRRMGMRLDDDSDGNRGVVEGGGVVGSSMNEDGIALVGWITMLKKMNLVYQREKALLFQCSRSSSSGSSSNRGPFESWPSSDPVMAQWRASRYPSELTTMR